MKILILTAAASVVLGAAACESTGEGRDFQSTNAGAWGERAPGDGVQAREASARIGAGYEREIETRGTVVDALPFLLRGEGLASDASLRALAVETPEGVFLLLPPGESGSDTSLLDPDGAEVERLDFDLTSLRSGDRVRLSGEVYRRGGLQGIEVESVTRE